MKESINRSITYLRVSVTDRCNLRCVYCMPPEGISNKNRTEILSFGEITRVVEAAAGLGVERVRLTGGEPLVRSGLPALVATIAAVPGIEEVTLTTNGLLLNRHAEALVQAGLRRVNVSLDTLVEERFREISRVGQDLMQVMSGIRTAQSCGLDPIKVNVVVVRGCNDDELEDLARLSLLEGWHIRFIELMSVGQASTWGRERFVPVAEMKQRLEAEFGYLEQADSPSGNGPAEYYRLPGADATVGFISPVSHRFCHHCNRLRLTAEGQLRPCLLSDVELDLRTALRSGASAGELRTLVLKATQAKPSRHWLSEQKIPLSRVMAQIGG